MRVRQRFGQLIRLIELFPINELRSGLYDGNKKQVGRGRSIMAHNAR